MEHMKEQELLEKLITDKYEEFLWNECYYNTSKENTHIRTLLSKLQEQGVEFNFSVKLTSYLVEE